LVSNTKLFLSQETLHTVGSDLRELVLKERTERLENTRHLAEDMRALESAVIDEQTDTRRQLDTLSHNANQVYPRTPAMTFASVRTMTRTMTASPTCLLCPGAL